ncbi:hypothetical protein MKW94_005021 [Papaver nudicaule]|uniref:Transmembrane protein n=1 Tax=Papaver nudicaule TaxID=74823 RepID=A0AA41S9S4_PAPNU|nr:hypothetical protein [Papaver nudicaule]
MGTKNVKVFIWLGLVVALLLISSQVSAVKNLAEKTTLQKDPIYGVSGVNCAGPCCEHGENRFGSFCTRCC